MPGRLILLFAGAVIGAMLFIGAAQAALTEGDAAMRMAEPGTQAEGVAVEPAKAKPGLPQMDVASYPGQIFWLFLSFAVLYVLMWKVALPQVGGVLELRRETREGNLKRAEQLQEEAARATSAYEAALAKAQEAAQEAMGAAEQEISEKLAAESAKFAEQARKRVATAEQNIAKAKADALSSLADISADISVEIVSKVAAVQVTKADAKKAVADIMKKEAA
jgi:F-type H+-transporting ATPase subunit b